MREPSVKGVIDRLQQEGWAGLDMGTAADQLRRAGASDRSRFDELAEAVFGSPAGQELLETLLDMTLRRPTMSPIFASGQPITAEQLMPYTIYREGQNAMVLTLLHALARAGQRAPERRRSS